MKPIRYLDMFAGIGGFRTGLTNAGDIFVPVGWCEIDKYAQRAYRALYETEGEYFCDDATKIDTAQLPEIDLITAGFPCQPFSVSVRRRASSLSTQSARRVEKCSASMQLHRSREAMMR